MTSAPAYVPPHEYPPVDPRVEALVNEVIGRVADKWTMIVLDVLAENGELRFTRVGELAGGISQKMLTQTLRTLERDGLVTRTVTPSVPVRVDYELTELGLTLLPVLAALKRWSEDHFPQIEAARDQYDRRTA